MRYLLILSLVLITGCSTLGIKLPELKEPSFETSDLLAKQKPLDEYTAPVPAIIGDYPKVKVIEGKTTVYACFEEEGFREIVRMRGYNEMNIQEVHDLESVVTARTKVANDWLAAAQASEKEANGLKQLRAVDQSEAAREKRELTKTLWRDRIIGGGAIVLLILAM